MAQQQKLRDATRSLAKHVQMLTTETQDELNKLHALVGQQSATIAAMVRLLGDEAVALALKELKEEAKARQEEQQGKGVAHLVEKGILKPVDAITEAGFVVGIDKLPDGSEHRVQFEMAGIQPEFQPLYLGKKPGDAIEGNGATLTILEVYDIDPTRAEEVLTPKEPAEVTAADAQAAAEASGESAE